MGDFRNFPDSSETTAKHSTELECTKKFEITGNRLGGASGAYPVKVDGPLCPAWAKPANANADNAHTPAHEKIVADLAHKLGFPAAPVMLSRLTQDKSYQNNPVQLPAVVALSFDVLNQPKPWTKIEPLLNDQHKASLCPQLSAALALHCLVDDHDHDWNDANALFEINDDGTARTVFYDYAWSLSHQWKPPAPPPDRPWARRNGPYALTGEAQIIAAVEQIECLEVTDLKAIIERIPPDCLPADVGKALIDALDQRRTELRKLLNLAGAL